MTARDYCPVCGAGLVSEPIDAPLKCKHCGWHLVTLEAWRKLEPFHQGYTLYAQSSWPTSELAHASNPYKKGTSAWEKFCEGQRRATLNAQDGEE